MSSRRSSKDAPPPDGSAARPAPGRRAKKPPAAEAAPASPAADPEAGSAGTRRRKPRAKPKAPAPQAIGGERRLTLIAEAAYYRAERRGFQPGSELVDWLEAEAEVEALLRAAGG